jgi:hypothetical protein
MHKMQYAHTLTMMEIMNGLFLAKMHNLSFQSTDSEKKMVKDFVLGTG